MLPTNALALARNLATANGLVLGAFYQFESLDKLVVVFDYGIRKDDGEIRWHSPCRADGRSVAFSQMPRIILREDGTVFRNLLFNPFA